MYKNIIRATFLFATGIFMTACSSGDDELADNTTPVTPDTKEVTLTGIISASGDLTRAVGGADGKEVYWQENDEICVQYTSKDGITSVKGKITEVINLDTHLAKFTATLTNLDPNSTTNSIGLAYPYSNVTAGKNNATDFAIKDGILAKQAGTIAGINDAKLDIAWTETEVPITIDWTKVTATLNSEANLSNQVSLCKFSLKVRTNTITPETYSPLSATKLEIILDDNSTPTYTITPDYSTDVFYVVMQPRTGKVSLKATYKSASPTGAILDPASITTDDVGKIIAVDPDEGNQAYLVDLSNIATTPKTLTKDFSSSTKLNKGKFYKQDVKYTTDQYLPIAVMAHVDNVSGVDGYCEKFIALALEDVASEYATSAEGQTLVSNWTASHAVKIASNTYDALNSNVTSGGYDEVNPKASPVTSTLSDSQVKGWRVPTVTDWRYVFKSLCNNTGIVVTEAMVDRAAIPNGTSMRTSINGACGNNGIPNEETAVYWTGSYFYRTEDAQSVLKLWRLDFHYGFIEWLSPNNNAHIRMLLAY